MGRRKKKNKVNKIIKLILLVLVVVIAYYGYKGYTMYKTAIDKTNIETMVKSIKTKKHYTSIEKMPKMYLNAVVAVEDHRFYSHPGVDIIAIGRALLTDIKAMKLVEGGSTITQQLAKNTYFTQDKTLERKIAETLMAIKYEIELDKNEILELYLNTTYFGNGYYTVSDAIKGYFKKEPINMTVAECALLAGIPNAPSVYAPTVNKKLSKERQQQVIHKMIDYGYLQEENVKDLLN